MQFLQAIPEFRHALYVLEPELAEQDVIRQLRYAQAQRAAGSRRAMQQLQQQQTRCHVLLPVCVQRRKLETQCIVGLLCTGRLQLQQCSSGMGSLHSFNPLTKTRHVLWPRNCCSDLFIELHFGPRRYVDPEPFANSLQLNHAIQQVLRLCSKAAERMLQHHLQQ
jgi:hypothetical protein